MNEVVNFYLCDITCNCVYLELYQFHNSNLHSIPELFVFIYEYQYHISIEEGYIRLNQMHVFQKVPFVLLFYLFLFFAVMCGSWESLYLLLSLCCSPVSLSSRCFVHHLGCDLRSNSSHQIMY